jgi:hypothetical protein
MPLLLAYGHSVSGATRSSDNGAFIRKLGARPVEVDLFDAEALAAAVLEAKPEIVIHQLTDLAAVHDPAKRPSALARNARIRDEGTRNLVAAARKAGASVDRAEHRLGLRAWSSALRQRSSVRPECGGRSGGERAGRRVARAAGPRRVAGGRASVALWPAIWPRQRNEYASERAFAACRCGRLRRLACDRSRRARCLQHRRSLRRRLD